MADKYAGYGELKQNEKENEAYTIFCREGHSEIAVIAPHGGGIEPGTVDIADVLAGCEHAFYTFKGLKKTGNKVLHINSNGFDEPLGVGVAQNAFIVVSVHGSKCRTETVHVGGRHQDLKQKTVHALRSAGFDAEISKIPGLMGIHRENICNRCRSGQGVQLEIARGLREKLFDNLDHRSLRKKTPLFYEFVNVLKGVLSDIPS